ncbi:hypothetical protein B0H14DRAFT_2909078 [Mycena olivaceomarginata]|nr:hypothetical protein B0H14DRAFT_2909078 [Mycena olivaceomarginata]
MACCIARPSCHRPASTRRRHACPTLRLRDYHGVSSRRLARRCRRPVPSHTTSPQRCLRAPASPSRHRADPALTVAPPPVCPAATRVPRAPTHGSASLRPAQPVPYSPRRCALLAHQSPCRHASPAPRYSAFQDGLQATLTLSRPIVYLWLDCYLDTIADLYLHSAGSGSPSPAFSMVSCCRALLFHFVSRLSLYYTPGAATL